LALTSPTSGGLAYADVNLLGDNVDSIKKNTETLIDASEEVGLEKTKYMLLSRHQNVGQNRDIKIATMSIGNVSQFKSKFESGGN
jgi:hypothetical protein